ncbi:hypothetical protein LQ567_24780 [Niabella pedocola]|uniref:Uncharacterized protein n=1 Tax=Niabella pedocola TaxID=1752077 RepID=A0ABS8Q080_9BACT|nr:hypothetical protein [Niabella pedocola]MCD2426023.1 hypothetical protein [Niabella pedocola]
MRLLLLIIPVIPVGPLFAQSSGGALLNIRLRPIQTLVIHKTAKQEAAFPDADKRREPAVTGNVTAFSTAGHRVTVKTDNPVGNANEFEEGVLYNNYRKPETPIPVFNKKNQAHNDYYSRNLNARSTSCKHILYTVTTR